MKVALTAIVAVVLMTLLDIVDIGLFRHQPEWLYTVLSHTIYRTTGIIAFISLMVVTGQIRRN